MSLKQFSRSFGFLLAKQKESFCNGVFWTACASAQKIANLTRGIFGLSPALFREKASQMYSMIVVSKACSGFS